MLRVALPNKGTLADPAATMMREAGYRQRSDSRDLSMLDEENEIEFFYLRPKDIATYVGSGDLHLGVTGADLMDESGSQVKRVIELGFGRRSSASPCRTTRDWKLEDLEGNKIATSYPRLVRAHLARNRIRADIIKLDGAVEISVQLGLADAIADVVSSGRTLRQHGLKVIGEPIAESEATLIEREPRPDREETVEVKAAKVTFTERLRGVVYARQFLMLDYDCPDDVLEAAKRITPGMQAPTVAPLTEEGWFAVRSMVRRQSANKVMDDLAELGVRAILTSEIRSCRAVDGRSIDLSRRPAAGGDQRGRTINACATRPTCPRSSKSRPDTVPIPVGPSTVCASTAIHSPSGGRCRCSVSSVLTNSHSAGPAGMPRRCRSRRRPRAAAAGWAPHPSTSGTRCRPQAVPGPGSPSQPRSQRHSTESMKPGSQPGGRSGRAGIAVRGGQRCRAVEGHGGGVRRGDPPRPGPQTARPPASSSADSSSTARPGRST